METSFLMKNNNHETVKNFENRIKGHFITNVFLQ